MDGGLDAHSISSEGKRAYQAGNFSQAAAAFSQAAQVLRDNGRTADSAEAANNASVAYLQAGDAAAALKAAEGSDSVFASVGDLRRQGMALGNQAAALEGLGQLEAALEHYTWAAEFLKQVGENEMRALVLKNISTLQLRTGKQLQALASMDAALDNQKRLSWRERLLQKLLRVPLDMLKRR